VTRSNNEIPVRRREGGVPWWAWLIGLALLALALLFLTGVLGGNNNNNAGASPTAPVTSPQGGGTSPATSPDAGGTSPDAGGTSPDAGGASPDASPASSWVGPDRLTVAIPASLNAA
jgi:hypothetical protein